MKVAVKNILRREEERVVLECVEMTREFQDIKEYVLMKDNLVTVYLEDSIQQIRLYDILYFEAVGEQIFAYTADQVYMVKYRLYELEKLFGEQCFVRCSKSVLVNIRMIKSFRPALDSRYFARLKNGEDIIISRMYAKQVKQRILEGRL